MTLSSLVDRLEAAGLVRRSEDHEDRRAKRVEITAAADPVLAEIRKVAAEVREIAKGDIPATEWDRFRDMAERARSNLRNARAARGGK